MAGLGLITFKDIPCWYELDWRGKVKPPAIIVRIHKEFALAQGAIPSTALLVKALQEEFRFSTFSGRIGGKYFGFEKAFRLVSRDDDGFLRYGVRLPKIRRLSDEACPGCKGKKKDPDIFDSPCLHCEGEGKECVYDWDRAFAVSASFTLFTAWASLSENRTSAPSKQLMSVRTGTRRGSSWVSGEYGRELVGWLSDKPQGMEITEMVEAMKIAYDCMVGLRYYSEYWFTARVENKGWLNVSCPGDACGLHPDYYASSREEGDGYEFNCHNVDTPVQQLTLLAGLAALHDKVRQETSS